MRDNSLSVFLKLLRAGLWEHEVSLFSYQAIDYNKVYQLAEEQSVAGIVTAGIEHIVGQKAPQDFSLMFIGSALQLEQRSIAMNIFIADLIQRMRANDIYTLLVKGQGIAQCYERPLWRAAGDVDLYLSKDNYDKAKKILVPLASEVEEEDKKRLHLGMTIDSWIVELHGTMYTKLSKRMNNVSDEVHHDIFNNGNVRSWNNQGVQVFLPCADNDVIIIFSHIINHFYGEGIGLRQICDWCRLLWTYRSKLDLRLLECRIRKMGLMSEWKAFASLAVDYLGMPSDAMPFYIDNVKYKRKADRIMKLTIESGSFGTNKDYSYRLDSPKWKEYIITFFRCMGEFARIATIFPWDASKFFVNYSINRIKYTLFG